MAELLTTFEITRIIMKSESVPAYQPDFPTEIQCRSCRKPITMTPPRVGDRVLIPNDLICSECVRNNAHHELEKLWRKVCPSLFIETDISRLPGALVKAAKDWLASDRQRGLHLIGDPRIGKTRIMWMIRKKLFWEKISTRFLTSGEFADMCASRFDDVAFGYESCKKVSVLFLDDLGKERLTDRVLSDLFALVDFRMKNRFPIISSSNLGGKELIDSCRDHLESQKMKGIILRIAECSEVKML